jgi:hypothetical protein
MKTKNINIESIFFLNQKSLQIINEKKIIKNASPNRLVKNVFILADHLELAL